MARRNEITEFQAKVNSILDCVNASAALHGQGAPECTPEETAAQILANCGNLQIDWAEQEAAIKAMREQNFGQDTEYFRAVADALESE
jgi:hypothetical protein